MRSIPIFCCLVATLALAACDASRSDDATAATTPNDTTANSDAAKAWVLAELPDDAGAVGDVREAKASAAEGDRVVLRGIIGGRADAMSDTTASFTMVDTRVDNPCVSDGDDHCKKPWDYCCTPREELLVNTATVQVVGDDGSVRKLDLRTMGVEPLDTVVVIGTVAKRPSAEVLTIKAEAIHVIGS